MHINQNLSAIIANNHLLTTENNLQSSIARLSSGYRINSAKDDPAGMAISNRMKQQIDGLSQASRNSQDGTSALDTADGALNEITSILQRMRELSVQAASDTNTTSDKSSAQQEIASLKKEVDRISTDTEFNTKSLLDGSLDTRIYSSKVAVTVGAATVNQDAAQTISVSDYVAAGKYTVTAKSGSQATYATATDLNSAPYNTDGKLTINGYTVDISGSATVSDKFAKIREAAEYGNCTASLDTATNKVSITSNAYGNSAAVDFNYKNSTGTSLASSTTYGTDATATLTSGFSATATVSTEGNKVTVTDMSGFNMSFKVNAAVTSSTPIDIDVTDMGTLNVQVGSNENQTINVRIPTITTASLDISDADLTTVSGAASAITKLDSAIEKVTAVRSKVGAYENRMDYAKDSLDQTGENLTSAISRIKDVDMATEMTNYSQAQVLQQAATSVLTQANNLPQQVLQLLQR